MNNFKIGDIFSFEKLIAPTIIKIVYWIGLIGIAIAALLALLAGLTMMQYSPATGLGSILLAFVYLFAGTLFWRILMELYTVIFGIYDRLGEIRDRLPPR